MRKGRADRTTKETKIVASVVLDGTGKYDIGTGIGFLDHMLEQLSRHSLIDIKLNAEGDLHVDYHHTTEDSGIVLGQAVAKALGDRAGIARYGEAAVPMDETLRTDKVSLVSGSVSLASTLAVMKLVSSSVVKAAPASLLAVGLSLRPSTVIVTVAVSVPPLPSLTV